MNIENRYILHSSKRGYYYGGGHYGVNFQAAMKFYTRVAAEVIARSRKNDDAGIFTILRLPELHFVGFVNEDRYILI